MVKNYIIEIGISWLDKVKTVDNHLKWNPSNMTKIQTKFLDGTKVSKLNVNGNENGIFSDYIYAKIWRSGKKTFSFEK